MSWWAAFAFDRLAHPWVLLLAVPVIVLAVAECRAGVVSAVRISTGTVLARMPGRRSWISRYLPPVARAAGLAALLVALARPLQAAGPGSSPVSVTDIMLCVDVSGSMQAVDLAADGEQRNRLSVTKAAVHGFLSALGTPAGGGGAERIGLVLYAGYAWTQCPLTLDHDMLARELDAATIDERDPDKRGTAIGSAIGLAVSKLRRSEARSKAVILLTDGRNNRGELDPITAARFARDFGIRVYTIAAGGQGQALVPSVSGASRQLVAVSLPADLETLKAIATATDGQCFSATDLPSLKKAYAEIDRLEKTRIEVETASGDYEDVFVPWAVSGGTLVLATIFVRRLWLEPIP